MHTFNKTSLICCSLLLLSGKLASADDWYKLKKTSKKVGISGIAPISDGKPAKYPLNFLVVHDNKKPDDSRLAIVELKASGETKHDKLEWPDASRLPIDLESLSTVPGQANNYMAMTSKGNIYYFEVGTDLKTVHLKSNFDVKPNITDDEYEAFSLQKKGGALVAVWAKRGTAEKPARIYWSSFDLKKLAFGAAHSSSVTAPWPKGTNAKGEALRHIADLRVDKAGQLYAIAAIDNGDDGPFDSFCYVPGKFVTQKGQFYFVKAAKAPILYKFPKHKVEALEFLNIKGKSSVVFGTDDENLGTALQIRK